MQRVREKYLDNVTIGNFNSSLWDKIRDKLTDLVSDPFKSVSESFSSINKKYRPITFLATLAISTWLTSAVVRTGIGLLSSGINPYLCRTAATGFLFDCQNIIPQNNSFWWDLYSLDFSSLLSKFNFSMLTKETFFTNGKIGFDIIAPIIAFQSAISYLLTWATTEDNSLPSIKSAFKFLNGVSPAKFGMDIGIGYNMYPSLIGKIYYHFNINMLRFQLSQIGAQLSAVFLSSLSSKKDEDPTKSKLFKASPLIAGLATIYLSGAYDYIKKYFSPN